MSMVANAWAWSQLCGGEMKLALLALADNCDIETGRCTISTRRLVSMTGISEGILRLRLAALAEQGYIRTLDTGSCDPLYELRLHGDPS